jgi:hypothetical protein
MALAHERTIGSKGHGLFNMPGAQLPAYIQHVYNDMVEGGKKPGSLTYRLAIGIVQNWAEGHDGHGNKVSSKTQAKAVAAVAEWEKLKAKAHARKDVTEASAEERDAAGRLAALLRDPATSPRTLDRAASAAALLAGARPRDHAEALALMEAMADCGCGEAKPPELAEAKFEKKGEKKDEKAEGGEKDGKGELEAEVARMTKKGMPEKLARKAACKKLGVKEAAEEPVSHSRLAPRLAEGQYGATTKKLDTHGSGKHSPDFDTSRDTTTGKQVKRHSRMAPRLTESLLGKLFDNSKHPRARGGKFAGKGGALSPMKGKTSNAYGNVSHSRLASGGGGSLDSYIASNDTPPLASPGRAQRDVGAVLSDAVENGGLVEYELHDGTTGHGTPIDLKPSKATGQDMDVVFEDADAKQFRVPRSRIKNASPAG